MSLKITVFLPTGWSRDDIPKTVAIEPTDALVPRARIEFAREASNEVRWEHRGKIEGWLRVKDLDIEFVEPENVTS